MFMHHFPAAVIFVLFKVTSAAKQHTEGIGVLLDPGFLSSLLSAAMINLLKPLNLVLRPQLRTGSDILQTRSALGW